MNGLIFERVKGTVIGAQKISETKIYSSGGGGYVGQYGGRVQAPKIHSTSSTNMDFFLLKEDGIEVNVKLRDRDIPLREGQQVTMLMAKKSRNDSAYWVGLFNHNTMKIHFLLSDSVMENIGVVKRIRFFSLATLVLFLLVEALIFFIFLESDFEQKVKFIQSQKDRNDIFIGFIANSIGVSIIFSLFIYFILKMFYYFKSKVRLKKFEKRVFDEIQE